MGSFAPSLKFVLEREGGFVDDPDDPGGATNQGVTQSVYDEYRIVSGLQLRSVAGITDEEVKTIYRERYWLPSKGDKIPDQLALVHFDTAVNMGVGTAARMLQTALSMTVVDGIIGKKTLAAAQTSGLIAIGRYMSLRITRYIVLVKTNAKLEKFLRGWLHRLGALLQAI